MGRRLTAGHELANRLIHQRAEGFLSRLMAADHLLLAWLNYAGELAAFAAQHANQKSGQHQPTNDSKVAH
jgi:hypothetical protein